MTTNYWPLAILVLIAAWGVWVITLLQEIGNTMRAQIVAISDLEQALVRESSAMREAITYHIEGIPGAMSEIERILLDAHGDISR